MEIAVDQAKSQERHENGRKQREKSKSRDQFALDALAQFLRRVLERELDQITSKNETKDQKENEVDGPDEGPEINILDEIRVAYRTGVQEGDADQKREQQDRQASPSPVDLLTQRLLSHLSTRFVLDLHRGASRTDHFKTSLKV